MSCLPCSKVNKDELNVVKYYKKLYKTKGIEFYVYRLNSKDNFNFISKEYFNEVFKSQIQPNFINGSEYFHISEFKQ